MKWKAVINPVSGRDEQRRQAQSVITRLRLDGTLTMRDIHYTSANETQRIDPAFLMDSDAILVSGGDGTLHEVLNAMKHAELDRPIAYLPSGTSNDFGCAMNLPRTSDGFLEMLRRPAIRQLDLGRVGEHYFHYAAAVGALSTVSYATNQRMKNVLGSAAYVLSALPILPRACSGERIRIECDELQAEERAMVFLVSNSARVGGFERICPGARMDDGYLHVLVIRATSPLALPGLLHSVARGDHISRPEVLLFKTRQVRITAESGSTGLGLDGEPCGALPSSVSVVPGGLQLFVPREQAAA